MTKPRALVGTVGMTLKVTDHSSLQAAEMEAMCRILEKQGYEALVAQAPPAERARAPKFPTGRKVWNGEGKIDLVWIHQQTPNYIGGVSDEVCVVLEDIARGLHTAEKAIRLAVDNNETMRFKAMKGIGRRRECESFALLEAEVNSKMANGLWMEAGIPECADPDQGLPFIYAPITSEQLMLTKEVWGTQEVKTLDFGYVGTSRANKKKQSARLESLGDFLTHGSSLYTGSLFGKRCGFVKGWEAMSQVKAQLIVRDPGMDQTPLHRYLQALMHDAIPIVLNESAPVAFIHSEVLQDALRVSTLEEGLDLVERREELLPLLREERDYWIEHDQSCVQKF